MDPTSDEVLRFWAFMRSQLGSTVVNKDDAAEMRLVAEFLDKLGIQDKDHFLKSFATTIGTRIYVPFEVGVAAGEWDLWSQVCIGVHEHQHIVQYEHDKAGFTLGYVTSKASRAQNEMEAYRTYLEMSFWRYGDIPATRPVAEMLTGYGCRPEDVDVVDKNLQLAVPTIREGGVLCKSSRIALGWLNANAAHWRQAPPARPTTTT